MSTRTLHVSLSIRGALATWKPSDFEGLLVNSETGEKLSPEDAKRALLDQLANGRECLPFGDPCEGFDYGGGGCPGHPTEAI